MEQKKKVLFVCNTFWLGGPTTWMRRACEHLPHHGWTCKLVLPGTRRPYPDDWNAWPAQFEMLKPVYSGPGLVHGLAAAIGRFRPDVVVNVALDCTPNAIRLLRRSASLTVRYIDSLQNDNAFECERLRPHTDVITAVAVPSEGCGRRVCAQIPELADRVVRFWCPAPCAEAIEQNYASRPLRLVYLGRLFQHGKRILDLVPLCQALVEANVDFALTVIGDGPERAAVEEGIRSIPGIGHRVRFLGWLANKAAVEVLRQQHIFLMLSDLEGQPIAMLEAMGCGVVPVVTDIAALREVIRHGENGFLVPLGDMKQFAATLADLDVNRDRVAAVGEAAWRSVRGTWETSVAIAKLADLLEDVARRPLPSGVRVDHISYPATRMTRLGIPHFVQGMKRWLLRQDVVW